MALLLRGASFSRCDAFRSRGRFSRRATEPKRSSAANGPVNRARPLFAVFQCDFDPRTNRSSIALDSHEFQIDPVIAIAGIFEETQLVAVAGNRSSYLRKDIFVAI